MDEEFTSVEPPSLVDLCINTAIDNIRHLGDVGETELYFLERILPHCTVDQLRHVEKSTKVSCSTLFLYKCFCFASAEVL